MYVYVYYIYICTPVHACNQNVTMLHTYHKNIQTSIQVTMVALQVTVLTTKVTMLNAYHKTFLP